MRFITKPVIWALIACLVNNPIYGIYAATGLLFFKPFPAFAEDFINSAAEGQNLGTDLMTGYSVPLVNDSTGEMTMMNGLANGQVVQRNELFQEIQPGSMDGIAASYGDAGALGTQVTGGLGSLTTGTSTHALAYQTLMGAGTSTPNMYNDPMWKTSDDIYTMKSPLIGDLFTGCEKKTSFSEKSCSIHLEDLKTCKKTLKTTSCKVTRSITVKPPSITKVSGTGIFKESVDQILIEMGDRDIHSQGKGCPAITWTMTINIIDPSQIRSVKVTEAGADDNVLLQIDGATAFETGGCSNRSGWDASFDTDITSKLKKAGEHKLSLSVLTGSPTHDGGGYLTVTIDKKPDIEEIFLDFPAGCRKRLFDNWPPEGSVPAFVPNGSLNDKASTDWWKCTDASNSKNIGGINITPDPYAKYLTPILPDPPKSPPAPICYTAETRVPGRITLPCFTDKDGYEVCPDFDYSLDEHASCDTITKNPACAYVGETCADGAISPITGACYEYIVTYDCGTDYPSSCDGVVDGEKTICDSTIRCMGGECVDQAVESNKDFTRAATGLQLLNQVQQSNGCDLPTGDCALFAGEPMECQMADLSILGKVDCCNMPIEGSWIDYMWLARNTWELADTSVEVYSIAQNGALLTETVGAWNMVSSGSIFSTPIGAMTDAYGAITQPFTSMYESVASMLGEEIGKELGLEALKQQAVQWLGEWGASIFGDTAAATLLTATSSTVAGVTTTTYSAAGSMLSSIVSVVGIIYAIYQIAKLVVSLVFACTEEEVKLNMLKQQKLCTSPTSIGTYCSAKVLGGCAARKEAYCCFSSPFAKIFQEQARPQLGKTFGDPKKPDCAGLTVSDIGKLDFNKMDFSEWVNMLKVSNQLPSSGASADDMYANKNITKGKLPNTGTSNAQDRLETRTNGTDMDAVRQYILDNL